MSVWDNIFDPHRTYRHSREIEELQMQVNHAPDHTRALQAMQARLNQVELLNRSLIELLTAKGVLTEQELSVMMQQVDLLDGVEDGKISAQVHANAPRCGACGRYANPKRQQCVYCGEQLRIKAAQKARPVRMVTCAQCRSDVPEQSTYYAEQGVLCEGCFSG